MKKIPIPLILLSLFFSFDLFSQCFTSQVYTTPGTYSYTIPAGIKYRVELRVRGADGGSRFGNAQRGGGAPTFFAFFDLAGGDVLDVYVGAAGQNSAGSGSGGGGSAVVLNDNTVLLVAGGGGGASALGAGFTGSSTFSTCTMDCGGLAGTSSGGGGFNQAGGDGSSTSTGGGAGTLISLGDGGLGFDSGDGGLGWGGGGGGVGGFGGGGGGYEGGDGSSSNNVGGRGGVSYFSDTNNGGIVNTIHGIDGLSNGEDGSVTINCIANLPVELQNFSGQETSDGITLNWSTASEIENEGFEIEHSNNGREWSKIGFIKGQGNTTEQTVYAYQHNNPVYGNNYYRLKQLDFTGIFEYSSLISVFSENQDFLFKIYPNPVHDKIRFITDIRSVKIMDQWGRIALKIDSPTNEVNVTDLIPGLYFIKIESSKGSSIQKIIKK